MSSFGGRRICFFVSTVGFKTTLSLLDFPGGEKATDFLLCGQKEKHRETNRKTGPPTKTHIFVEVTSFGLRVFRGFCIELFRLTSEDVARDALIQVNQMVSSS